MLSSSLTNRLLLKTQTMAILCGVASATRLALAAPEEPKLPADDRPPPAAETRAYVEQLPASAFPAWTTRGVPGGSLELTLHGVPWPYYPRTGIGVSGSVWVDVGYESIERGNPSQQGLRSLISQARGVARVTPTYTKGAYYAQAQLELVANADQSLNPPAVANTDDAWVRVGRWNDWDVQFGRFEAFEVYHFGLGMDLNTQERKGARDSSKDPPDVPGLPDYVYRQNGMNNVAAHKYFGKVLRLELLGQFGLDAASTLNGYGGRPAAVLDFGTVKLKASADARRLFGQSPDSKELRTQRGGSFAAQVVLAPYFEAGVNAAIELIDHWGPQNTSDPQAPRGDYDAAGSTTTTAFGGFANVRLFKGLVAGGGINVIVQTDQVEGKFTNMPAFGALQYQVNPQLYFKGVFGYDKFHLDPGNLDPWTNTMLSGRFRVLFLF